MVQVGQDGVMERIVLLRGINVGGHRKVPMALLRHALVDAGFDSVRTYIQSGNVLVEGGPADDSATAALVQRVIGDHFGVVDVGVIVLSPERLERARAFSVQVFPVGCDDVDDHARRVHVVFLAEPPAPTRRASLHPDEFTPDRFTLDIHGGSAELHVAYAGGAGSSKLTTDRIERGFGVRATARNLNTINRLLDMMSQ
jgi:uncharacterized protein (DUF1697 family)